MALSKLRDELIEILPAKGITELYPLQVKVIDAMKSGKNLLVEAHDGAGKSKAALLSVLVKIKEPGEGSPRAIVVCSTNEKAKEMHDEIYKICRLLDLTVDLVNEKGNIIQQRNDVFDGTEIIIGTPRRLYDLYIQNGFNVGQMKLFILDDALTLFKEGHKMRLQRIAESLPKCQHILFSHSFKDERIESYIEDFVINPQLIEE
jgi:superfamily II DNA/RNA helicase